MIFYTYFYVLFALTLIPISMKLNNKNIRDYIYIVILITLIIFASLRGYSRDTRQYYYFYIAINDLITYLYQIFNTGFKEYFIENYSKQYQQAPFTFKSNTSNLFEREHLFFIYLSFIKVFFSHHQFVYISTAIPSLVIIFYYFKKISNLFLFFPIIYFSDIYLVNNLIQIKYGLAVSLLLPIIYYNIKKKFILSFFLIFVASQIHFAMISVYIIFVFNFLNKNNMNFIKYFFIILFLVILFYLIINFLNFELLTHYIYADKFKESIFDDFSPRFIYKFFLIFLIMFYYKRLIHYNEYSFIIINLYFYSFILILLFHNNKYVASKLTNVFEILTIVIFLYIIDIFFKKTLFKFVSVVCIATFFFIFNYNYTTKIKPYGYEIFFYMHEELNDVKDLKNTLNFTNSSLLCRKRIRDGFCYND